jgi:hypothetical protein
MVDRSLLSVTGGGSGNRLPFFAKEAISNWQLGIELSPSCELLIAKSPANI